MFQRESKKPVDQTKKSKPVPSLGYKKKRRRYEQKIMYLFIPLSQKLQSFQADLFTGFQQKDGVRREFYQFDKFSLDKKIPLDPRDWCLYLPNMKTTIFRNPYGCFQK